ncbi:MAG: hypothetical protein D3924_05830 [Candidatus Electrothrix sp. AR4]|nr:hypothetical protein [Candidatus Electrothrix sp. AR4]
MRFAVSLVVGMAVLIFWTLSPPVADATKEGDKDTIAEMTTHLSIEQVERTDIDNTAASMGYTELSAGAEWQFLLLDINHRIYDWGDNAFLGSKDPLESLTQIVPGVQYYQKFSDTWSVWIKGVALAGFEDALSSESITYNPQVVTFYFPTQRTTLYCGVGMLYHPADTTIYPVVGVAWNMDAEKGFFGTLGFPETTLRYGFTEKFALKLDVQWDNRIYQLAEDNTVAQEGYLQIEDLLPGLHLEYKPLKNLMLSVGVRRYFDRQLTFFDQEENELTSSEVDESWAYLLGITYTL